MDFKFSPEEEAFRLEVRQWIEANLPAGWGTPEYRMPEDNGPEWWALRQDWQRKLYEGGWAALSWPKEYGGREATIVQRMIFAEEMARVDAPWGAARMGVAMVGPTIMVHGTEEQKARFIPKILSGEEVWCQGFSEPDAGSDLASLQTRAEEDGDDYVINGSKVWTSGAHHADWCILLTRTDPNAEKHRGITYLLMDMKSPGITIKPLPQITGSAHFNQLFLENVRVPKKNMLGEKNRGWYVAITTLMNERSYGGGQHVVVARAMESMIKLAQETKVEGVPLAKDPKIRQEIADCYIKYEALRLSGYRTLTRQIRGEEPGPEGSTAKLFRSELAQQITDISCQIIGPYSQLARGSKWAVADGSFVFNMLNMRGATISGGTSEIQRNIIAERVLGLPK